MIQNNRQNLRNYLVLEANSPVTFSKIECKTKFSVAIKLKCNAVELKEEIIAKLFIITTATQVIFTRHLLDEQRCNVFCTTTICEKPLIVLVSCYCFAYVQKGIFLQIVHVFKHLVLHITLHKFFTYAFCRTFACLHPIKRLSFLKVHKCKHFRMPFLAYFSYYNFLFTYNNTMLKNNLFLCEGHLNIVCIVTFFLFKGFHFIRKMFISIHMKNLIHSSIAQCVILVV